MALSFTTKSYQCTITEGLAHLVLDQPERGNPIDGVFCAEFGRGIAELGERDEVRALLISARGKMFSVGGDLAALAAEGAGLPTMVKRWTADLHVGITRMTRMRAPVVVAVHGAVAGGSVALMAAADIVVIARSAKLSAAFTKIGFSADSGSTPMLSARMGLARAKRFLLMAETLDAEAALAASLVDRIADDADVMAEALTIARDFARGPTEAYGAIKRLIMGAQNRSLETQLEDEAQALAGVARTADAREGVLAFREKRKPVFAGR